MQLDMHFYGIYALARAAGIRSETAFKIAYSSQFVDDAISEDAFEIQGRQKAVLPIMTSHKPIDYKNALPGDQWRVWVAFHFLPGNEGENFVERMICRQDSGPAQKMINHALDSKNSAYWPYLIGVTAHVYADTFSHFGFIGLSNDWNKVINDSIEISEDHSEDIKIYVKKKLNKFITKVTGFLGNFAEIIPVGHGSVGTLPDRPYLKWRFEYETGVHSDEDRNRKNFNNFLDACKRLHEFFSGYANLNPQETIKEDRRDWGVISGIVEEIIKLESPMEERIKGWKGHLASGSFCSVTDMDVMLKYDENLWQPEQIRNGSQFEAEICGFYRAVWRHREYVLNELLPEEGLIV